MSAIREKLLSAYSSTDFSSGIHALLRIITPS